MRIALLVVLVGACTSNDGYPGYVPTPTSPPSTGETYGECSQDSDCPSGDVCTRDEECLLPSEVRAIHVTWTIGGQPAGADTCANAPALALDLGFEADGYSAFGFAPVACDEGEFTIDKLPTTFDYVWLSEEDWDYGSAGPIDGSGDVALDLPY